MIVPEILLVIAPDHTGGTQLTRPFEGLQVARTVSQEDAVSVFMVEVSKSGRVAGSREKVN